MIKKFFLITSILFLLPVNLCFAITMTQVQQIYNMAIQAGIALTLLAIIWGGVRYILSIGDPHLAAEAKTWVISGFTGLIILVSVNFIIKGITGREPTFEVSTPPEIPEVPEETEWPGVYFYWVPDCLSNNGAGGNIQSIKIINSEDKKFAVVIESIDKDCKVYYGEGCHSPLAFTPAFSHPYELNFEAEGTIFLYRRPYYSGKYYDKLKDISVVQFVANEIKGGIYLSNLVINDGECKHLYEPGTYCLGSIEFSGPYVVVLYNEEDKCEIYEPLAVGEKIECKQSNLKTEKIFSQSKPFKLTIIPSK